MLTRTIPTLSDGTRIDDLINVETREVQLRVMADVELHELEMERIFGRTWVLLGFVSEVPNAGDFVVRDLGADQVLVTRGRDGGVNVLLNVCPHRGMRVATTECGNTQVHKCIYHGWAFKTNGDFIGSPVESEQMHGAMMPKSELGLRKARTHIYGNMIFATWNHEGPSFDEFLGEMKWYYDMLFQRTDGGLEVLGPPQKFTIPANWKTAGEQSAADGFHTLTLHRWLGDIANFGDGDLAKTMYGVEVSHMGHAMRCPPVAGKFKLAESFRDPNVSVMEKLEILPPPGVTKEMLPELERNLTPEQLALLVDQPPQVGGMFPNILIAFIYIPQADGRILGVTSLHTYVPRGPHQLEFTNWILAERDLPDDLKIIVRQQAVRMLGTSGMIEQDDSDTWPHMTRNARGPQGKTVTLKYQAVSTLDTPEGWPGPAIVYNGFSKDCTQWNWWLRYLELMTAAA